MPDAVLEIWQANHHGRYNHPGMATPAARSKFNGYGRIATQSDGEFCFTTIKPGPVPFDERRLQAPHIRRAPGLRSPAVNHLYTRLYFADE